MERCGLCGGSAKEVENLRARIAKLEAQLAERGRDTERLDWLDSTRTDITNYLVRRITGGPSNPAGIEIQLHFPRYGVSFGYRTIREALDAARTEQENQQGEG